MSNEEMFYKDDVAKSAKKWLKKLMVSFFAFSVLVIASVMAVTFAMNSSYSAIVPGLILLTAVPTFITYMIMDSNMSYYVLYSSELNSLERNM